jgi:hypothetical protein
MATLLVYVFYDCPGSAQMDMTRRFPQENAGLPHPDNQDRHVHDVHTDCNVDEQGHTILEISCISLLGLSLSVF